MKKIAIVAASMMLPMSAVAGGPILYGKIHMSVAYVDNDSNYKSVNVASHSSRIGVKGDENIGAGLKVGYQMEWQVGMDGSKDLSQRNRGVTLSGDYGTIFLGRRDTPMKDLGKKFDLFRDQMGDTRLFPRSGSSIDNRHNNVIGYISPNLGGLDVFLAYVADVVDAAPDNDSNNAFSGTAVWSMGGLELGLGYTQVNAFADAEKDYRFGASYKTGNLKFVGAYTDIRNGKGSHNYHTYNLGVAYKMGNNTAKIQYAKKGTDALDDGAQEFSLGLEHKMSKRTKLYLEYTALDNSANSDIAYAAKTGNGLKTDAGGAGSNPSAFALGIIHKF